MTNNPIAQVAQMYNLIEDHLRRAATHDIPLTLSALNKQGDIKAIAKSGYQVRDLIKSLVRKGFVLHDERGYRWAMNAGPFVLSNKSLQRTRTEPSEPKVQRIRAPKETVVEDMEKAAPAGLGEASDLADELECMCRNYQALMVDHRALKASVRAGLGEARKVKPAKDIELVIGDTLVVIGRNPVTHRLRITIEDVGG